MKNKKYLFYSLFAYIIYIFLFTIYSEYYNFFKEFFLFEECKYRCLDFEHLWINQIIPSFKYIFGAFVLSSIYTLIDKKESLHRVFFLLILVLIVLHALNHFI
jgi:hypothetical protein